MAGFEAALVEYADDANGPAAPKKRAASEYIGERKLFVEFIRNFRRGREAYYRYDPSLRSNLSPNLYLNAILCEVACEDLIRDVTTNPNLHSPFCPPFALL